MTEGYRAREDCHIPGRYILKKMLGPLRLSNLSPETTIRQLAMSRSLNNPNTETEAEAEASLRARG